MLQPLIARLTKELDLPPVSFEKGRARLVFRNDLWVDMREEATGVLLQSPIGPCPKERREELFLILMKANYLGQGTAGARIGMDGSEKTLTLSVFFPYELNYEMLRMHLEDFLNYLTYWRVEVGEFGQKLI